MAMTSPHPLGYPLIAASPFFGPVVITSLTETSQNRLGDFAGVVLWVTAYAGAAAALLAATLVTFDRCLGRIETGVSRLGGRDLRPVELTPVGSGRDKELVRQ